MKEVNISENSHFHAGMDTESSGDICPCDNAAGCKSIQSKLWWHICFITPFFAKTGLLGDYLLLETHYKNYVTTAHAETPLLFKESFHSLSNMNRTDTSTNNNLQVSLTLGQGGRTQIQMQTREQSFNERCYFKTSKSLCCHRSSRQSNHKYFLSKPTRSFLTPEVFKPNSKGERGWMN